MKKRMRSFCLLTGFCSTLQADPKILSQNDKLADARAERLVSQMTEDEKFSWLSGPMAITFEGQTKPVGAIGSAGFFPSIPRLGIPAQQQADASLGISNMGNVRPGDNATALPSSLLLGATFDPDVAFTAGSLVGSEARAKGFNVQLAGGANLIREPRGGRNFEYISEDPLLTGIIAGESIAGIQSHNIVSTIKHFAMNAQETGRVMANSVLNESAMRESDLLAFQIAIEIGKPGSVMTGYNLINGDYASENAFLINKVLKGDWQYPGWVMSDWGAVHSTEKAIMAGTDVQSGANIDPEVFFGAPLRHAVQMGRVPQSRIDDAVRRQIRSLIAVGAVDNPIIEQGSIDYTQNKLVAQRVAEAGIVLLKNDDHFLPLEKGKDKILVVGHNANIGVLSGGGSSAVSPVGSTINEGVRFGDIAMPMVHQPSSPLLAIQMESSAARVTFNSGTDLEAVANEARDASVVIIYAEEWRSEGRDAKGLSLPKNQDALIAALAAANPNVVVVLQTGGAVLMPWLNDVKAVLSSFYPGSGGADAISGVLFGRVNPSGRLPITFPASPAQLSIPDQIDPETTTSMPGQATKGDVIDISYNHEGSDVGYRWHEREKLHPLFPFGYGLSYTNFEYKDLKLDNADGVITASVTVTNIGDRAGADVPQVYVSLKGESGFVSRLAGFQKVHLAPGESQTLSITTDPRFFARFDSAASHWNIAAGEYQVSVARNAGDFIQTSNIHLAQAQLKP